MRLTGFEAIEFAEKQGLTLHKSAGSIDAGADALSIAEAEAIADDDPDAIWLDVPADEYYAAPRNMEPGAEPTGGPQVAGQRPEAFTPAQNSRERRRDVGA